MKSSERPVPAIDVEGAGFKYVCSLDFEDSLEDAFFTAYPRTMSLRFETSGAAVLMITGKVGGGGVVGSASSCFAFSMSDNALKPWYLYTTPVTPVAGPRSVVPSSSPSFIGAPRAPQFRILIASRSTPQPVQQHQGGRVLPTLSVAKGHKAPASAPMSTLQFPRAPWPSFLQSSCTFRNKTNHVLTVRDDGDTMCLWPSEC